MKNKVLVVFAAFFSFALYSQQNIEVKSYISKDTVLIGEHFNLQLSVVSPNKILSMEWPQIDDSVISNVEVINKSAIDTTVTKTSYKYLQNLTLITFDSGYIAIPSFEFKIKNNDGSLQIYETPAYLITVKTIDVDTTGTIKPIITVIKMPVTFSEVARKSIYVIIAGIIVALFIFIYIYYKKHKKLPVINRIKPVVPPNRKAIDSLYALENKKLWQNGQVKDYYSAITDIWREYIAGAFGIPAVEMITEDIFDELKCQPESYQDAYNSFSKADMIKFAKAEALAEDNIKIMEAAYNFVNSTWLELKAKEKNVE